VNIFFKNIKVVFFIVTSSLAFFGVVNVSAMRILSQNKIRWYSDYNFPMYATMSQDDKFVITYDQESQIAVWDTMSGTLRKMVTEKFPNIEQVKIFKLNQGFGKYFIVLSQAPLKSQSRDDLYDTHGYGLTVFLYDLNSNELSKTYSYKQPNRLTSVEDFIIRDDRFLHIYVIELVERPLLPEYSSYRAGDEFNKLSKKVVDLSNNEEENSQIDTFDESVQLFASDYGEILSFVDNGKMSMFIDRIKHCEIPQVKAKYSVAGILDLENILLGDERSHCLKLYNIKRHNFIDLYRFDNVNFLQTAICERQNIIAAIYSLKDDINKEITYLGLCDFYGNRIIDLQLVGDIDVYNVNVDCNNVLSLVVSMQNYGLYVLQISLFDYGRCAKNIAHLQTNRLNIKQLRQILFNQQGFLTFDGDRFCLACEQEDQSDILPRALNFDNC
jgi:hypothetical protein